MNIDVRMFAGAREAVGQDMVPIALPIGATVADLRGALSSQYPALAPWVDRMMIAMDHQYAGNETAIDPAAEIACIPPVSGG